MYYADYRRIKYIHHTRICCVQLHHIMVLHHVMSAVLLYPWDKLPTRWCLPVPLKKDRERKGLCTCVVFSTISHSHAWRPQDSHSRLHTVKDTDLLRQWEKKIIFTIYFLKEIQWGGAAKSKTQWKEKLFNFCAFASVDCDITCTITNADSNSRQPDPPLCRWHSFVSLKKCFNNSCFSPDSGCQLHDTTPEKWLSSKHVIQKKSSHHTTAGNFCRISAEP